MNHLSKERSPYLLDHASNPVDWFPWGEEALNKAKQENKPIFLSIGYHTCHWCHVMAHESFEDEVVARILNDNYICIKVDREERPDIDAIYMNACQLMTGSGGWPLNLWLTPEQAPFYAGTYFPKDNRYGHPGFVSVLTQLNNMWQQDRDTLVGKSQEIKTYLGKYQTKTEETVMPFVLNQALKSFEESFDDKYGGFGQSPKFPSAHQLIYLTHYDTMHPSEKAKRMILKTLDAMYLGGIYDHIGGGFARYSVDEKWLVPHFEKMLYDNALLLRAYNYGYLITHNPLYKKIAYHIVEFLSRELLSDRGGFYTALDADSEREEGKYYLFTPSEIKEALESDAGEYMIAYDISDIGNFEGKNIPNRIDEDATAEFFDEMKPLNDRVLAYRERRVGPSLDNKILTSMNGLILTALSHMYRIYQDEEIMALINGITRCDKVFRFLDDFAYYAEGLIELYMATGNERFLAKAMLLVDKTNEGFWDNNNGGYYLNHHDDEQLILRPIDGYDGAVPSGNSVMAMNLLKLSRLCDNKTYQERYDQLIRRFGKEINGNPRHFSYMLTSLLYRIEGTSDMIVSAVHADDIEKIICKMSPKLLKYFTVQYVASDFHVKSDKVPVDGKVTYYHCKDYTCNLPVHEI